MEFDRRCTANLLKRFIMIIASFSVVVACDQSGASHHGDGGALCTGDECDGMWLSYLREQIVGIIEGHGEEIDLENGAQAFEVIDSRFAESDTRHDEGQARLDRLEGRVGGADGTGEWRYTDENGDPAPKTRTIAVPFASGSPFAAHVWSVGNFIFGGPIGLTTSQNNAVFLVPLTLPDGATITAVRALVAPGAARETGRTSVSFFTYGASGIADMHSEAYDDGTADLQWVEIDGLSIVVDNSETIYQASVRSSDTASTNSDRWRFLQVDFTAPRPYR